MPTDIERNIDIARRKDETDAQYALRLGIIYGDFVADMAKSTDIPLPTLRAAVITQLFDDMFDANENIMAMAIIQHSAALCFQNMKAKNLLGDIFNPQTEH